MKSMFCLLSVLFIFPGISARAEEYRQLFLFHEGLVVAQTASEEWVVLNEQGMIVLSLNVSNITPDIGGFSEGLMVVTQNRKCGYIDKAGNMIIPPRYIVAKPFSEGLAEVKMPPATPGMNGKWGYINKNGDFVIAPVYDNVMPFREGRAFVYRESAWLLVDKTGKVVGSQTFGAVKGFSEGTAAVRVQIDGKHLWGYIDRDGAWRIPPHFTAAFPFNNRLAGVAHIDRPGWDFIDQEGNVVFERVVDTIQFESSLYFREGWAIIPKGNKHWYLSTNGRRLPAIYDYATSFNEGVAVVWVDGKGGVIDQTGNWIVLPGEYEALSPFSEGKAAVRKDGKVGCINTKGEWLF
jgi:hypothetical protein